MRAGNHSRQDSVSSPLLFTFPVAKASNVPIFMGHSVGDLELRRNATTGRDVVADFKLFVLHYMVLLIYGKGECTRW